MTKLFKFIIASVFASLTATAFAQCMPMNSYGPPRIWDGQRGCYVPQGTPSAGTFNGYPVSIPVGIGAGQPFNTVVGGRRMTCSVPDRLVSGLSGAAIGNVSALALNLLSGREVINRDGATVLGGLAGSTVMCNPMAVDDGDEAVVRQQGHGTGTCRFADGSTFVSHEGEEGCRKIARQRAGGGNAYKPVVVNGHTCTLSNSAGAIIVDFLNVSKNPYRQVVSTGEECVQMKQRFIKENNLMIN